MNVITLPAVAWLLAQAYAELEARLTRDGRGWPGFPRDALLAAGLLVSLQLGLHFGGVRDPDWVRWFKPLSSPWWFVVGGLVAAGVFAALGAAAPARRPRARAALLALVVVGAARETLPGGGQQWSRPPITELPSRVDVRTMTREALETPRTLRHGTLQLGPVHNAGLIPDWYFKRYRELHGRAFRPERELLITWKIRDPAEAEAYATLLGLRDGQRLFLTRSLRQPSLAAFVADAAACPGRVQPLDYDGNALRVRVVGLTETTYLTFVDNWAPGWEATVDGAPAPLLRTFGTFKAVALPAGDHEVRFVYRPWAARGDRS